MDAVTMLNERCVHIVDDEAKVRDAFSLLLSTAQIELKSYGSAEEYLTFNPLEEPACYSPGQPASRHERHRTSQARRRCDQRFRRSS